MTKIGKHIYLFISILCTTSGCATSSKNISGSYVSSLEYRQYDCEQLSREMFRIQGNLSTLAGKLDEAASNDKILTGVGIVIFWPALIALGGTKSQENELSRLKGEYNAIQQEITFKNCSTNNFNRK